MSKILYSLLVVMFCREESFYKVLKDFNAAHAADMINLAKAVISWNIKR